MDEKIFQIVERLEELVLNKRYWVVARIRRRDCICLLVMNANKDRFVLEFELQKFEWEDYEEAILRAYGLFVMFVVELLDVASWFTSECITPIGKEIDVDVLRDYYNQYIVEDEEYRPEYPMILMDSFSRMEAMWIDTRPPQNTVRVEGN